MIERKIQTEAYWRDEFAITDQDVQDLGVLFLEVERPLSTAELTRSLIERYCQREEDLIRRQLSRGKVYRPNGAYETGEELVFSHLDFALGTVVDLRDGHNPEYGDFKVITVEFEGKKRNKTRSFAAELTVPHKLSFAEDTSWEDAFVVSADDLYAQYGDRVKALLAQRLKADSDFAHFRGQWLSVAMLADVHIGLLNIADAMLDLEEEPLPPQALLKVLDLPKEIPQDIKTFSLNSQMEQDERFVDVGDAQNVVWGLQRRVPSAIVMPPERLQYEPVVYDRTRLDVTHLQLEREIDDEVSDLIAPPTAAQADSVTLLLNYPHWRCGSLPLTDRTRIFFPVGTSEQRTRVTFVDRVQDKEFPGWVVHAHRFVYGVGEWFEDNNIPVGAYIRLERVDEPNKVAIDVISRRMQREWVRIASIVEGELGFQMQKQPVACEYDEFSVMDEANREALDRLWDSEQELARPMDEIVKVVFLELAKLNSNGLVHSKALYNGVNILRRCPPGRVFATLFKVPQFVTTGDGYWLYQEHPGAI